MELTKIDILKYKSIKQPVSIILNKGRVVTLIGKNGSGKTNVLEAIQYALSKNRLYNNDKIECRINYHIELTDDEMSEYFSCVKVENESRKIIVEFDSNDLEKRLVYSAAIWIEAEKFKERLNLVLLNFTTAAQKYIKALEKIETEDSFFGNYIDIKVIDVNRGSLLGLMSDRLKYVRENIERQIDEIKKYINGLFDENKISLNNYDWSLAFRQRFWHIPFYKISEDEQIKISPIVASSLKISKNDLEKANSRLNRKLKQINKLLAIQYQDMQEQLDMFDRIKTDIANIFDVKADEIHEHNEQINRQFQTFIQKLRNIVFGNCYYLDNENSLIFYNSTIRDYRNEQVNMKYLNSRNPIVEACDMFLHEHGVLDAELSITQGDKLEELQIKRAVKVLNKDFLKKIVPKFDKNEILRFEIRYENGSLNLFVHEKNKDIVSFNDTSLGRRWYLTYQFVKVLLKAGDVLIIDEPAAFLHPQAQTEFKTEINQLSKDGIYVFCSTHSPYLIPENWNQVCNVVMTEKGTVVEKFESIDNLHDCIEMELGISNTANILFNLEKTVLLVEGVSDKICIEKFSKLLNRSLKNYYIHVCDGEAILQVAYICLKHKNIKCKVLLDNDNKSKNESFKMGHSMYEACIEVINNNPQSCVYVGSGPQGCIEDLFVGTSSSRYMYYNRQKGKWKVNLNAVKEITTIDDVDAQTLDNFEQLFNRLDIPKLDKINN